MFGLAERRAEKARDAERRHREALRAARRANAIQAVIALATVASVAAAVVSIVKVFDKNERIDELEQRERSINRSVGGRSRVFDVEDILVDQQDLGSVPDDLTYESDDRFFWKPVDDDVWVHEVVSEQDLFPMPEGALADELSDIRLHQWRRPEAHQVTTSDGATESFAFVTLERLQQDQLFDLFQQFAAWDGTDDVDTEAIDALEGLFKEGGTSAALQLQMLSFLVFGTAADVTPVVQTIDMRDGLAYIKLVTLFRDVIVDGEPMDEYYVTTELILLELTPDIAVIQTSVPTGPDRRSNDFELVNALLDDLLVVR